MRQRVPGRPPPIADIRRAFATTAPGLEGVLADELLAAGFRGVARGVAGVAFVGTRGELERACLVLRTAHRVLWTLGDVDAGDGDRLYAGVRQIASWPGLVPPDRTFAVHASARDNPSFRDARFAGLRTKDAIVDAVRDAEGARPSVSVADPDVQVRVAISGRRGVVSLDLAGRQSLHARGYRIEAGAAPLRESLAAGMLALAGHRDDEPVIDPCCGSGTILIEAALRARHVAPGLVGREYGFARWPGFRPERLEATRADLLAATRPPRQRRYLGLDLDGELLEVARENTRRARVADDIRLVRADATRALPEDLGGPGLVVTNPPYGARLEDRPRVVRLLGELGRRWREVLPGWRAAVLVGDRGDGALLGLDGLSLVPLVNGGLDVWLALGRIPSG